MNKLVIYNDTYWSLININDNVLRNDNKMHRFPDYLTSQEEKERISLSRTKRRIKEICLCNDFQFFMTVTVDSKNCDRFSLQQTQDKMKKICHKLKRKNKDFKFIFITEKHENGAFHFHGMVKNIDLYVNKNGYFSNKFFDELGYNSFSKIKSFNKCCNYITKYVTKACIKNENNQIYFCSRGLKKPYEEYMIPENLLNIFEKVYQDKYCQKFDFDITTLSYNQKIKLTDYFTKNDQFLQIDNNYITNFFKLFTNLSDKIKIIT